MSISCLFRFVTLLHTKWHPRRELSTVKTQALRKHESKNSNQCLTAFNLCYCGKEKQPNSVCRASDGVCYERVVGHSEVLSDLTILCFCGPAVKSESCCPQIAPKLKILHEVVFLYCLYIYFYYSMLQHHKSMSLWFEVELM